MGEITKQIVRRQPFKIDYALCDRQQKEGIKVQHTRCKHCPTHCNLTRACMSEWIETRSTDNAVIHPTIIVVSHRHRQKLDWRQHWETPNHTNHPVSDQIINETMRWSSILGEMTWPCYQTSLTSQWKTGQHPKDWKTAVLIPLMKKSKAKSDHPATMPTSLTSYIYIGTLVERIIIERLNWWLEHNNIITTCQAGFRSSYTTEDQLNILTQEIQNGLQMN